MDNLQTMKTVEILKNLARQWKVTIEFANSEMSATGEPVFRVSISSLDIEIEEPLCQAIKPTQEAVNDYFDCEQEEN